MLVSWPWRASKMPQVKLHRTEIAHADLEIRFDLFGVPRHILFGPADQNRMVPLILLVAPFDHFLTDLERQPFGFRIVRSGGGQYEFAHLFGMVEGQELRDSAAHGMTDHDGVFGVQVIHQTDEVIAKHLRRIIDGRFARLPGAAVIMDDHAMISVAVLGVGSLDSYFLFLRFSARLAILSLLSR